MEKGMNISYSDLRIAIKAACVGYIHKDVIDQVVEEAIVNIKAMVKTNELVNTPLQTLFTK